MDPRREFPAASHSSESRLFFRTIKIPFKCVSGKCLLFWNRLFSVTCFPPVNCHYFALVFSVSGHRSRTWCDSRNNRSAGCVPYLIGNLKDRSERFAKYKIKLFPWNHMAAENPPRRRFSPRGKRIRTVRIYSVPAMQKKFPKLSVWVGWHIFHRDELSQSQKRTNKSNWWGNTPFRPHWYPSIVTPYIRYWGKLRVN